jgi:2'-5' RNA ligase
MFYLFPRARNMPEHQLSLPFEAPQYSRDRLFFAILSPPDAALQIAERTHSLRIEYGLETRPIASERLHISLHGLGDYPKLPSTLIEQARNAGASVSMPQFEIAFDSVLSFDRKHKKRPLVLRTRNLVGLVTFQRRIGEAMKKAGLGRWVASLFRPTRRCSTTIAT